MKRKKYKNRELLTRESYLLDPVFLGTSTVCYFMLEKSLWLIANICDKSIFRPPDHPTLDGIVLTSSLELGAGGLKSPQPRTFPMIRYP